MPVPNDEEHATNHSIEQPFQKVVTLGPKVVSHLITPAGIDHYAVAVRDHLNVAVPALALGQ